MGGAVYIGFIVGSKLVLSLAVLFCHLTNWWFLSSVQLVTPFHSYTCHTYIRIRSILQSILP